MSLKVCAIDPGPEDSAFVIYDGKNVLGFGKWKNLRLRNELLISGMDADRLVIEQIASYGMAVGQTVFETCYWSGRFAEAYFHGSHWLDEDAVSRIPRKQIVTHICGNPRAKDANVRAALLDMFGGKDKAIGRKKTPGPLYGVASDVWAALALSITWYDLNVRTGLVA